MILPPFASPQGFINEIHPSEKGEEIWFIFSEDRLLIRTDTKNLPTQSDWPLERTLYLGTFRGKLVYAAQIQKGIEIPPLWNWCAIRELYPDFEADLLALAGRAMHLIHWDRSSQFCGCCGNPTRLQETERCRECSSCGQLFYPKLNLAVLALVKKGGKILLAQNLRSPYKFFTILAGFVEPGETLEQCVAREIQEEAGIRVKNISYFGSQPWPFSYSLMVGFTCDWESGEIQANSSEIECAAWFDPEELPPLPSPLSLSRILIDSVSRS